MTRGWWLAAAAVVASASPVRADSEARQVGDVRVELRTDDALRDELPGLIEPKVVAGIGADGAERWRLYLDDMYDGHEPVAVGDVLVLSYRADLLALDPARGVIVSRARFPGIIEKIAVVSEADRTLDVTVRDESGAEPSRAVIRHRLGGVAHGRFPWSTHLIVWSSHHLARAPIPELQRHALRYELEPERARAAYELAAEQEARDPTNPFHPLTRGQLAELLGRTDEARRAYAKAATLDGAVWSDLLMIYPELAGLGHDDLANAAVEEGMIRMRRAGVRAERLQTLLFHMVFNGRGVHRNLEAAVAAGDVEAVDAMAERRWRLMPRLERGPDIWGALAAWMRAQGRADLAEVWEQRADATPRGWVDRLFREQEAQLAAKMPIVLGFLLAVPIAALLVGLRIGSSPWSRRTPIVVLATVGLPILLGFASAGWLAAEFRPFPGAAPFVDDGFAAPSVTEHLEQQPPSAARDEVLAYARAEAAAARAGALHDGAMPDDATILDAMAPRPGWGGALSAADAYWWRQDPFQQVDTPLRILLLLLVPLLLGGLLGRFVPRSARVVPAIVPGGARSFGVAVGLALGVLLAGVLGAAGYWAPDGGAQSLRYMGLDALPAVDAGPSLWWYVPIAVVLALHGLLAWRERRAR